MKALIASLLAALSMNVAMAGDYEVRPISNQKGVIS